MDKQRQLDDFFGLPSPTENEDQSPVNPKHNWGIKEILERENRNFKSKLKLLPKVLSIKERYLILSLVVVAIGSIVAIPITSYRHFTEPIATYGGTIKEGIID